MGCGVSQQPIGAASRYRQGGGEGGLDLRSPQHFFGLVSHFICPAQLLVKRFDIFIAFADFKRAQEAISVSHQQVFVFIFKNY